MNKDKIILKEENIPFVKVKRKTNNIIVFKSVLYYLFLIFKIYEISFMLHPKGFSIHQQSYSHLF